MIDFSATPVELDKSRALCSNAFISSSLTSVTAWKLFISLLRSSNPFKIYAHAPIAAAPNAANPPVNPVRLPNISETLPPNMPERPSIDPPRFDNKPSNFPERPCNWPPSDSVALPKTFDLEPAFSKADSNLASLFCELFSAEISF